MKTRDLTAILWATLSFAVSHAQTGNGFPPLSPVPQTGQLTHDPTSTHFTFIAAGDNRSTGPNDPQPATLAQILKDSQQYQPAFILWSGDTIAGFRIVGKKMNRAKLGSMYQDFFSRRGSGAQFDLA